MVTETTGRRRGGSAALQFSPLTRKRQRARRIRRSAGHPRRRASRDGVAHPRRARARHLQLATPSRARALKEWTCSRRSRAACARRPGRRAARSRARARDEGGPSNLRSTVVLAAARGAGTGTARERLHRALSGARGARAGAVCGSRGGFARARRRGGQAISSGGGRGGRGGRAGGREEAPQSASALAASVRRPSDPRSLSLSLSLSLSCSTLSQSLGRLPFRG